MYKNPSNQLNQAEQEKQEFIEKVATLVYLSAEKTILETEVALRKAEEHLKKVETISEQLAAEHKALTT